MPTEHVVVQGECISSIAFNYGFFPDTIWNDSANAQLKRLRKDPNVLMPGDVVIIPDKRQQWVAGATEKRHRFLRKGVPEKLWIQVLEGDRPLANTPFMISIDGRSAHGKTDETGRLDRAIPPDAKNVKLVMNPGTDLEQDYNLELGCLDPVDQISGVQGRLMNLGFDCGSIDGEMNPSTQQAIKDFQAKHGLKVTGAMDEPTLDKLKSIHGS